MSNTKGRNGLGTRREQNSNQRNSVRKGLRVIVALALIFAFVFSGVGDLFLYGGVQEAKAAIAGGGIYENMYWEISDSGVLTLRPSGGGAYGRFADNRYTTGDTDTWPWKVAVDGEGNPVKDKITAVKIQGTIGSSPNFDTKYMFSDLPNVTKIDISGFNFATDGSGNVVPNRHTIRSLEAMFRNCPNLTEIVGLDVLAHNTVTNTREMFKDCTSLTTFDPNALDVSNVEDMRGMFQNCSSLTELDLSNWTTNGKVYMMQDFANGCSSMKKFTLNNPGFETRVVNTTTNAANYKNTNASGCQTQRMLDGCTSLEELDMSNITISTWKGPEGGDDGQNTFIRSIRNIPNLRVVNMNNVKLPGLKAGVLGGEFVFHKDTLQEFYFGGDLDIDDSINDPTKDAKYRSGLEEIVDKLIEGCYALQVADLSNWDTSSMKDLGPNQNFTDESGKPLYTVFDFKDLIENGAFKKLIAEGLDTRIWMHYLDPERPDDSTISPYDISDQLSQAALDELYIDWVFDFGDHDPVNLEANPDDANTLHSVVDSVKGYGNLAPGTYIHDDSVTPRNPFEDDEGNSTIPKTYYVVDSLTGSPDIYYSDDSGATYKSILENSWRSEGYYGKYVEVGDYHIQETGEGYYRILTKNFKCLEWDAMTDANNEAKLNANVKLKLVYPKAAVDVNGKRHDVVVDINSVTFKDMNLIPSLKEGYTLDPYGVNPWKDGSQYTDDEGVTHTFDREDQYKLVGSRQTGTNTYSYDPNLTYTRQLMSTADGGLTFWNQIYDRTWVESDTHDDRQPLLSKGSGTYIDYDITVDDALPDTSVLFWLGDLDVAHAQEWHMDDEDYLKDYMTSDEYGPGSEGIVLGSGNDLDTLTFARNTGLQRYDSASGNLDPKSGNYIVGTGTDPNTSWSRFYLRAAATGANYIWTSGISCKTDILGYARVAHDPLSPVYVIPEARKTVNGATPAGEYAKAFSFTLEKASEIATVPYTYYYADEDHAEDRQDCYEDVDLPNSVPNGFSETHSNDEGVVPFSALEYKAPGSSDWKQHDYNEHKAEAYVYRITEMIPDDADKEVLEYNKEKVIYYLEVIISDPKTDLEMYKGTRADVRIGEYHYTGETPTYPTSRDQITWGPVKTTWSQDATWLDARTPIGATVGSAAYPSSDYSRRGLTLYKDAYGTVYYIYQGTPYRYVNGDYNDPTYDPRGKMTADGRKVFVDASGKEFFRDDGKFKGYPNGEDLTVAGMEQVDRKVEYNSEEYTVYVDKNGVKYIKVPDGDKVKYLDPDTFDELGEVDDSTVFPSDEDQPAAEEQTVEVEGQLYPVKKDVHGKAYVKAGDAYYAVNRDGTQGAELDVEDSDFNPNEAEDQIVYTEKTAVKDGREYPVKVDALGKEYIAVPDGSETKYYDPEDTSRELTAATAGSVAPASADKAEQVDKADGQNFVVNGHTIYEDINGVKYYAIGDASGATRYYSPLGTLLAEGTDVHPISGDQPVTSNYDIRQDEDGKLFYKGEGTYNTNGSYTTIYYNITKNADGSYSANGSEYTMPDGILDTTEAMVVGSFENTAKISEIEVKKETEAGKAGEFTYEIKFDSDFEPTDVVFDPVTPLTEGEGDEAQPIQFVEAGKNTYRFTLTEGQKVTIKNVPFQTTYTVTELVEKNGWELVSIDGDTAATNVSNKITEERYKKDGSENPDWKYSHTFNNRFTELVLNKVRFGGLKDDAFEFAGKAKLTNLRPNYEYTYGVMDEDHTFTYHTAKTDDHGNVTIDFDPFTRKGNHKENEGEDDIVLVLPKGADLVIEETPIEGVMTNWQLDGGVLNEVSPKGATDTITLDKDKRRVTFYNTKLLGTAGIDLAKYLDGRAYKANDKFTFMLTAEEGTPMPVRYNAVEKTFDPEPVTVDAAIDPGAVDKVRVDAKFATLKYTLEDLEPVEVVYSKATEAQKHAVVVWSEYEDSTTTIPESWTYNGVDYASQEAAIAKATEYGQTMDEAMAAIVHNPASTKTEKVPTQEATGIVYEKTFTYTIEENPRDESAGDTAAVTNDSRRPQVKLYVLADPNALDGKGAMYISAADKNGAFVTNGDAADATLTYDPVQQDWVDNKGVKSGFNPKVVAEPIQFTNEYESEGNWTPEATKILNGRPLERDQFEFNLKAILSTEDEIDDENPETGYWVTSQPTMAGNDNPVKSTLQDVDAAAAGATTKGTNDLVGPVSYDDITYTNNILLKKGKYGTLVPSLRSKVIYWEKGNTIYGPIPDDAEAEVTVDGTTETVKFANATDAQRKAAEGTTDRSKWKVGGKTYIATTTDPAQEHKFFYGAYDETGKLELVEVPEDAEGTYYADSRQMLYKMWETNAAKDGYTYDSHKDEGSAFKIKVTVTENKDGTLGVTPDKTKADLVFTNKYEATGEVTIQGLKVMENDRAQKAGEFSFTITPVTANAPTPTGGTLTNAADGTIDFGKLSFTQEHLKVTSATPGAYDATRTSDGFYQKTFVYDLKETKGSNAGITYDGATIKVAITVQEDNQGKIKVVAVNGVPQTGNAVELGKGSHEKLAFTNEYHASGDVEIKATKVLEGATLKDGMFFFELLDAKGNVVDETSNKANGSVDFSTVVYNLAQVKEDAENGICAHTAATETESEYWTYTYTVKELVPVDETKADGVLYDTAAKTVKVKVTDNGQGTLVPAITEGENPTFTNYLETTEFTAKKVWADAVLTTDNTDGGNPMPGYDRPKTVSFQLKKDGQPYGSPVAVSKSTKDAKDNEWSYTWEELPKYNYGANNAKTEIVYTVEELEVPYGYASTYTAPVADNPNTAEDESKPAIITNTPNTSEVLNADFVVKKIDEVTNQPMAGVTFTVTKGGASKVSTTNEAGIATFNFTEAGTYTLTETVPDGYMTPDPVNYTLQVTKAEDVTEVKLEKTSRNLFEKIYDLLFNAGQAAEYEANTKTLTVKNTPKTYRATVTKTFTGLNFEQGADDAAKNAAIKKLFPDFQIKVTYTDRNGEPQSKTLSLTNEESFSGTTYTWTVAGALYNTQVTAEESNYAEPGHAYNFVSSAVSVTGATEKATHPATNPSYAEFTMPAVAANADDPTIAFTNTYAPLQASGTGTVAAVKQLLDREWSDSDSFAFKLKPLGKATYEKQGGKYVIATENGKVKYDTTTGTNIPMPASDTATATLSTDDVAEGEHLASFGKITYPMGQLVYDEIEEHMQGDFYYEMQEVVPGTAIAVDIDGNPKKYENGVPNVNGTNITFAEALATSNFNFNAEGLYWMIPQGASGYNGLLFDGSVHSVHVRVRENNTDHFEVQVIYDQENPQDIATGTDFTPVYSNHYLAKGEIDTKVRKTVKDRTWTGSDSFTFKLTPLGGADYPMPKDAQGQTVDTVTITNALVPAYVDGSNSRTKESGFGKIVYTLDDLNAVDEDGTRYGLFYYAIAETGMNADDLIRDESRSYVRVKVTDAGNGTLNVEDVKFYESSLDLINNKTENAKAYAEFTNIEKKDIWVEKAWTGKPVTDVTLRLQKTTIENPADTDWINAGRFDLSAEDAADPNKSNKHKFENMPAYEEDTEGNLVPVKYRVFEEDLVNGENGFTVTYTNDAPDADGTESKPYKVTNKYVTEGTATLNAVKQLLGRDWTDGDSYNFILKGDAKGQYDEDGNVSKIPNSANQVPMPGQTAKGSEANTSAKTPATKRSPEVAENEHLASFADIKFTLDDLALNPATGRLQGDFYYKMREDIPADARNAAGKTYAEALPEEKTAGGFKKDGVTYTAQVADVHVRVTDNLTGKLTTQVFYGVEGVGQGFTPVFINRYDAEGELKIPVTKHINARDWTTDDDFTFTLAPLAGSPMPYTDTTETARKTELTITLKKDTDADMTTDMSGLFEVIPLESAGTFIYQITENAGSIADLEYASDPIYVKVVVKDNGDGDYEVATGGMTFWKNAACTVPVEEEEPTAAKFTNNVLRDIKIEKTWVGEAVSDVTIHLQKKVGDNWETVEDYFLSRDDSAFATDPRTTSKTFENLPAFDANGNAIQYRVQEDSGTNYTSSAANGTLVPAFEVDETAPKKVTVTNTNIETVEISGTKVWVDDDNADNTRPEDVAGELVNPTLHLYRTSATVTTAEEVTKQADGQTDIAFVWNGDAYTVSNVAKYDAHGNEFTYYVTEETVENYQAPAYADASGTAATNGAPDGGTITNKLEQVKIEIPVKKVWDHKDNEQANWPTSVTLQLKNGDTVAYSEDVTGTADQTAEWDYTFEDVDKYDLETGKVITYTLSEVTPTGYVATYTAATDSEPATVTNVYSAAVLPESDYGVKKNIAGEAWTWGASDQFAFALVASGSAPLPADATEDIGLRYKQIEMGQGDNFTKAFGDIQFDTAGTYTYYIRELSAAEAGITRIDGMTYTTERYRLTVTVETDPDTGDLGITSTTLAKENQDGTWGEESTTLTAEFTNTFSRDETTYIMLSEKEYNDRSGGTSLESGQFTFTMKPVGDNKADAPMPDKIYDSTTGIGLTTAGADRVYFAKNDGNRATYGERMTFTKDMVEDGPVDFTYEIAEVIPDGAEYIGDGYWRDLGTNIVYDGVRHYRVIHVEINNENTLVVTPATTHTDKYHNPAKGTKWSAVKGTEPSATMEDDARHKNNVPNFLNHRDPLLIEVEATKVWDDNNNQDGIRPSSTTFTLIRKDGAPVLDYKGDVLTATSITLDGTADTSGEAAAWKAVWKNLPQYERVGDEIKKIEYQILETRTDVINGDKTTGYQVDGALTAKTVGTLTGYPVDVTIANDKGTAEVKNIHETTKVQIEVTKIWDDANNQDGIRPANSAAKFHLDKKVGDDGKITLDVADVKTANEASGLKAKWSDLPDKENGKGITYIVREEVPAGYTVDSDRKTVTIDSTTKKGEVTFTNSHTPEKIEIIANKAWNDNNNQDGLRTSVTFKLQKSTDGNDWTDVSSKTIATADSSTSWADQPTHELVEDPAGSGTMVSKVVKYRVVETPVPSGYAASNGGIAVVDNANPNVTITNTHTPLKTTIKVYKVWDDDNNHDGERLATTAHLYKTVGGTSTWVATQKATGNITTGAVADRVEVAFADLPVYENGVKIIYDVYEEAVPGYTTTMKYGEDGTDAQSGAPIVNWRDTKPDAWNNEIQITNANAKDVTEVRVTKVWDDANNRDNKRPAKAAVKLQFSTDGTAWADVAGATYDLVANENWAHTFTGLDAKKVVNNETKTVLYRVVELDGDSEVAVGRDCFDGAYKLVSITGCQEHGFTITNRHEPDTVTIVFTKTWEDASDVDRIRPTKEAFEGSLQLLADDVDVTRANASKLAVTEGANHTYIYTWTGLDKNKAGQVGQAITYKVKEKTVPNGYEIKLEEGQSEEDVNPATVEWNDEHTSGTAGLTNKHTTTTTNFTARKIWVDEVYVDGVKTAPQGPARPDQVTLTLWKHVDGTPADSWERVRTQDVTGDADKALWEYTFTNLPLHDEHNKLLTYKVTEENDHVPANYTKHTMSNTTIVNTRRMKSITGTKVWKDGGLKHNNADEVKLTLHWQAYNAAGETVGAEGSTTTPHVDWTGNNYKVIGLPETDANGNTYTYWVTETAPSASAAGDTYKVTYSNTDAGKTDGAYDDGTITNTLTGQVTIEGTKTWAGDPQDTTHNNADEVKLTLTRQVGSGTSETIYAEGAANTDDAGKDIVVNWNGSTYTFKAANGDQTIAAVLNKYDADGNAYTYTITEAPIAGYATTYADTESGLVNGDITNTYGKLTSSPTDEGQLTVTKNFYKKDTTTKVTIGEAFNFTLTGTDAPEGVTASELTAAGKRTDSGDVEIGQIAFTKLGTYKFTLAETTGSSYGVSYDETTYTLVAAVTDEDKNGKWEIEWTIEGSSETEAVFTNYFDDLKIEVEPELTKELTGRRLAAKEFDFVLFGGPADDAQTGFDANTKIEAKNTAGTAMDANKKSTGTVVFSKLTYTLEDLRGPDGSYANERTFKYLVYETVPGTPLSGVVYDTNPKELTATLKYVAATADAGEKLALTWTYKEESGITTEELASKVKFANTYDPNAIISSPTGTGNLTVTKRIDDSANANTRTPVANEFLFELKNTGKPTGSILINDTVLGTNDADGKVSFPNIRFDKAGDYTFTMKELAGNDDDFAAPGEYDGTTYTVVATVADQGNGSMSVSWKVTKKGDTAVTDDEATTEVDETKVAGFVNVTKKELVDVTMRKVWVDSVLHEEDSSLISLLGLPARPDTVTFTITATVPGDGAGAQPVNALVFDDPEHPGTKINTKTVTLDGTESAGVDADGNDTWVKTENNLPKYYNDKVITYKVTEENVPGNYTMYELPFNTIVNKYNITQISGTKVWEDDAAGVTHDNASEVKLDLHWQAYDANENPVGNPGVKEDVDVVWGEDGTYTIPLLPVTDGSGNELTYWVTEQPVPLYDTTYENGTDGPTDAAYDEGTIVNTYNGTVSVTMDTTKWNGTDPLLKKTVNTFPDGADSHEFTFHLKAKDHAPGATEPTAKVTVRIENDAPTIETVNFGTITFTLDDMRKADGSIAEEKEFTYVVTEQKESGWKSNAYTSGKTFKITVAYDEETGELSIKESGLNNELITNEYEPGEQSSVPTDKETGKNKIVIRKRLTGEVLERGMFKFKLESTDNPSLGSWTATNGEDGLVMFPAIAFAETGTYKFRLSEVNEGKNNITYDTSSYVVTCDVKDADSDGKFEFKWTVKVEDEEIDHVTFTNSKVDPIITVTATKVWDDENGGSADLHTNVVLHLFGKDEDGLVRYDGGTKKITKDSTEPVVWKDVPVGYELEIVEEAVQGYVASYDYEWKSTDELICNVTNTFVGPLTEVTVTKEWQDDNNRDKKRPTSVTFELWRKVMDGESDEELVEAKEVALSTEEGHEGEAEYTWKKLPATQQVEDGTETVTRTEMQDATKYRNKEDRTLIEQDAYEVLPDLAKGNYTKQDDGSYVNTERSDDVIDEAAYNELPEIGKIDYEEATVQVPREIEEQTTKTREVAIIYFVKEVYESSDESADTLEKRGYEKPIVEAVGAGEFNVINVRKNFDIPKKKLVMTKVWLDTDGETKIAEAPEETTYHLIKKVQGYGPIEVEGQAKTIPAGASGEELILTWEDLPGTEDDKNVTYSVEEDPVSGYKTSYGDGMDDGETITLTVTNTKQEAPKPDEITITYRDENGNVIRTETIERGAKETDAPDAPTREGYTFSGWKRTYDENGNVIYTATWLEVENAKILPKIIYVDPLAADGDIIFQSEVGEDQADADKKASDGKKNTQGPDHTAEGYEFVGWALDKNEFGDYVLMAKYNKVQPGGKESKTVTYIDGKSGKIIKSESTTGDGSEIKAPAPPSYPNMSFVKWVPVEDENGNKFYVATYAADCKNSSTAARTSSGRTSTPAISGWGKSAPPNTGDVTPILLYLGSIGSAVTVAAGAVARRRRNRRSK